MEKTREKFNDLKGFLPPIVDFEEKFHTALSLVNEVKTRLQDQPNDYTTFSTMVQVLASYVKTDDSDKEPVKLATSQNILMDCLRGMLGNGNDLISRFNDFFQEKGKGKSLDSHVSVTQSIVEGNGAIEVHETGKTGYNERTSLKKVRDMKINEVEARTSNKRNFQEVMEVYLDKNQEKPDGQTEIGKRNENRNRFLRKIERSGVKITDDEVGHALEIYGGGLTFFNKVQKKLTCDDNYRVFLNGFRDYCKNIIDKSELLSMVNIRIGQDPGLIYEFRNFLESCENYHGGKEEQEQKEKEKVIDIQGRRESKKPKKMYANKSIGQLDLSDWEKYSPSYYFFHKDYPMPCAGNKPALPEHVNNELLCAPQNYNFKGETKITIEEDIEDQRFEVDMIKGWLKSSVLYARKLMKFIKNNPDKDLMKEFPNKDGESFFLKCVELLYGYGEHGPDMIHLLHKYPTCALPVILRRLVKKKKEVKEFRSAMQENWKKQLSSKGVNKKC